GTVTILDENNHETVQTHQAFGNPDETRLIALRDPDMKDWHYTYDALGKLTKVTAPDGIERIWHYLPGQDLLEFETQPESGTTSYTYYGTGNVETKRDAKGTV